MTSAFAPTATSTIATVDTLRHEFPGWQLEVDVSEDGTPSVCAYLFWQVQGAESYALAFVPDPCGMWVALDNQCEVIEELGADLASSMRTMLSLLGTRQAA